MGSRLSVYLCVKSVYSLRFSAYNIQVMRYVRKNITLPAPLDARLRKLAKSRGDSQSGLIVHLVALGLATQSAEGDPLLRYLGAIEGPPDLSETVDRTVYGAARSRR